MIPSYKAMNIISKINIWRMKNKIRVRPFIGVRDPDGTFQYKKGRITIRYAITASKAPNNKNIPHWISIKIRTSFYANSLRKSANEFTDFWRYQKWLVFFRPSSLITLMLIGLIIYTGAVELQPGKGYLTRWLVSRATGISPSEIEYRGDGWIKIYGIRTAAVDRAREPFSYNVNVFRWLVFNDTGSVTRDRGKEYGPVTHEIGYDESGQAYIKKEGTWRKGEIENGIKWDKPQGAGIREGKIKGETIESTGDKIRIRDR